MIYDLKREDTLIQQTVISEAPSKDGSRSCVQPPQFKRQVTSTSVSVSVVASNAIKKEMVPIGDDRVKRIGAETMKRNCDLLLTGIGDTQNGFQKGKPKQKVPVTLNYYKDQNQCLGNSRTAEKCDNLEKQEGDAVQNSKLKSQPSENETEKETTCCFQLQPSLSNNKVTKASKREDDSEEIDIERNETDVKTNEKNEKVSLRLRLKAKFTKRKVMAAMCPCFTYLILESENEEKQPEKEKEQSDRNHQEIR